MAGGVGQEEMRREREREKSNNKSIKGLNGKVIRFEREMTRREPERARESPHSPPLNVNDTGKKKEKNRKI